MVVAVAKGKSKSITVSPVTIQIDLDGYHAQDVCRRVFNRNVLYGEIEVPGVSEAKVVNASTLLIHVIGGYVVEEVRKLVINKLQKMILDDAPADDKVSVHSYSDLTLKYQE